MKTNQKNNDVNEKGTDLKVNINTEKKYIVFPKDFALFSLGGLLFFDCCLIEILYNCYMPFLRHNALFENLLLFLVQETTFLQIKLINNIRRLFYAILFCSRNNVFAGYNGYFPGFDNAKSRNQGNSIRKN